MGNVTIGREAHIISLRSRSGNNRKYFIIPDGDNAEQVIVCDISVSGTRHDVDLTRGFMWRNKSFVDVNGSSTSSRSVATFLSRFHEERFVDGIDLTDIKDMSNGSSLVRNGQTYSWNVPPPNTTLNGLFIFRRELYYVSIKVCYIPCRQMIVHTIQIEQFLTSVHFSRTNAYERWPIGLLM